MSEQTKFRLSLSRAKFCESIEIENSFDLINGKNEPRDKFYRQARAKGLPSRAAFKIEELLAKIKIPSDARVIDLAALPADGWPSSAARLAIRDE